MADNVRSKSQTIAAGAALLQKQPTPHSPAAMADNVRSKSQSIAPGRPSYKSSQHRIPL